MVAAANWHLKAGTTKGTLCHMKTKQFMLAVILVGASATSALAQEVVASGTPAFGVGAEQQLLGGATGAVMVYDMGLLRIDGILGFLSNPGGTKIDAAGRLFWAVHRSTNADFSLGGGLGVVNTNPDGAADSTTNLHVEALAQIRVFLAANVALSTTLGLGVGLNDGDDTFGFGGQFVTNGGLVYYFR